MDKLITKQSGGRQFLLDILPKESVGAEIGVHLGDFSRQILDSIFPKEFHLIDPWEHQTSSIYKTAWYGGCAKGGQPELDERYSSIFKRFNQNIQAEQVKVHRGYSADILQQFPDQYFDWVYIDGNHLYEYVKKDLELSIQKVKLGGYITGDDYIEGGWWEGGVKKAVDEFANNQSVHLVEIFNGQFIFRKNNVTEGGNEMEFTPFVITGIPRSGTTLMCRLLNCVQNVVCMNEIPELYEVPILFERLRLMSYLLKNHKPIPMNVNEKNEIITDTQDQQNIIKDVTIQVNPDMPLIIGSKINIPYLNQIDMIHEQGIKIIAVIKDPIYAITSWNMRAGINEHYMMPEDFKKWPRYSTFDFKETTLYGRQCEIWEHYIKIILDNLDSGVISSLILYQDIIKNPRNAIDIVLKSINSTMHAEELNEEIPELKSRDIMERFDQSMIIPVARNVMRICKTRQMFWN